MVGAENAADTVNVAVEVLIVNVVNDKPVAVCVTVTLLPELPSKITVSVETGTAVPPGPLLDVAQCVVSELSQVPEPPTQNLLAIYNSFIFIRQVE